MKVLIVGSGGREHAIAWAVSQSAKADKIYCAPGNAGIEEYAECVNIGAMEFDKLVAFAKEKEIDLLLLDIEMPEMDGFDTLSQIRGFSDVKAAFITATRDYDTIEKAREMGVEDYITKPFLPAVFLETIHGIIE